MPFKKTVKEPLINEKMPKVGTSVHEMEEKDVSLDQIPIVKEKTDGVMVLEKDQKVKADNLYTLKSPEFKGGKFSKSKLVANTKTYTTPATSPRTQRKAKKSDGTQIKSIGKQYIDLLKNKFKILEYIKHYQTDFTTYDQKLLLAMPNDDNEFILSMRETGSNLLCFSELHQYFSELTEDHEIREKEALQWKSEIMAFHYSSNTRFLHGKNGEINEITLAQAKELFLKELQTSTKISLNKEPSSLFKLTKRILMKNVRITLSHYSRMLYDLKNEESEDEFYEKVITNYLKTKMKKKLSSTFTIEEQMLLQKTLPEEFKDVMQKTIVEIKEKESLSKYFKPMD